MTTATDQTYTYIDGRPFTPKDLEAVEGQIESLMSGRYFADHAASSRSVIGYQPPMTHRQYADVMGAVARMAGESNVLAQIAHQIRINLYGTKANAAAAIYDAAGRALSDGYDDVIGRSAPDAGNHRLSSFERDFTLRERVVVAYHLAAIAKPVDNGGIGWVLDAIGRSLGVREVS